MIASKYDFLPLRPRRLISLADMIQFLTSDLMHDWQWLLGENEQASEKFNNSSSQPNQTDINRLNGLLKGDNKLVCKSWLHFCNQLKLDKSKERIERFLLHLNVSNSTCKFIVIHTELNAIKDCLWKELREKKFVFIPDSKADFFERDDLFGQAVNTFFGKVAQSEIKSAGNCLAADENTAAVFHLMRVAELGLRKVAQKLHITIKHELDLADWSEILKGIKKKLEELELKKRTRANEQKLTFYNSIYEDLKGIKHLWRNPVMHARGIYNMNDALGVLSRVRDLMQRLAGEIPAN